MCDAPDTTTILFPPGFTGPGSNASTPSYWGPRKRIFSRTGYNLCISPAGKVYGTRKENDKNADLIFHSTSTGVVSIKGEQSSLYLGFNEKGRLQGMVELGEECLFEEKILQTMYNVYLSQKYSTKAWYVAINKRGKARNGKKTRLEKKSSQFLPRDTTDNMRAL